MVLIHLKRGDRSVLLFNVPAATDMDTVTRDIIEVHNLRLRVISLVSACKVFICHTVHK